MYPFCRGSCRAPWATKHPAPSRPCTAQDLPGNCETPYTRLSTNAWDVPQHLRTAGALSYNHQNAIKTQSTLYAYFIYCGWNQTDTTTLLPLPHNINFLYTLATALQFLSRFHLLLISYFADYSPPSTPHFSKSKPTSVVSLPLLPRFSKTMSMTPSTCHRLSTAKQNSITSSRCCSTTPPPETAL